MINLISVLVILVIVGTIFYTIKKGGRFDKNAAGFVIPVVLCGIILHITTIIYNNKFTDQPEGVFIALIHSIFCTLKIFTLRIDIVCIQRTVNDYFLFGLASAFVYISAAFSTISIIFNLLLKSLINTIMIKRNSRKDRVILIGNSEYMKMLVEDIKNNHKTKITVITDSKDEILRREWYNNDIAVLSNTLSEEVLNSAGTFSLRNKVDVVCLFENDEDNLDAGILICDYMLKKIENTSDTVLKNRLIKQLNLSSTKVLTKEEIFSRLDFSCSIMYKDLDREEHFRFADKMLGKVRFFNLYDLVARKFIMENPITAQLPSDYIDTNTAKIKGKKTIYNLFVGFNNTNKQMLIKNICNNQMTGQDFNAEIFDSDLKDREQDFRYIAAGIFGETETDKTKHYIESPVEANNIKFSEINVSSKDFYDYAAKLCTESDYCQIIISLDNENESIETALRLRQVINEVGKLSETGIFVKTKSKKIAAKAKLFNEDFDRSGMITFFGNEDEIFTYDVIVNEKLDEVAKKLFNTVTGRRYRNSREASEAWNSMSVLTRELYRFSAFGIRVKLNLIGLDIEKTESEWLSEQDYFSIYYENDNERRLKEEFSYDAGVEIFSRDVYGFISATKRNNLARLEQLRQSVVHLVNGWTKMPIEKLRLSNSPQANTPYFIRSDEKVKQNAIITTFEGLEKLANIGNRLYKQLGVAENTESLISELINYNYSTMDNLPKILKDTGYSIVKPFNSSNALPAPTVTEQ